MTIAQSGGHSRVRIDAAVNSAGLSVSELLRLLGSGATGSILLALEDGPLRTKELTARVPGYGTRTVYRYVARLVEIGAIERDEKRGVPSKVVHYLTEPCGVELGKLVEDYATATLETLPGGGFVPHTWGTLTLIADLWETGMYDELAGGPCTATELARVGHELSFHQVSRRTNLYLAGGLIQEAQDGRRRRHYELTEEARQATALIAGLGRWRERHVVPEGEPGLTEAEAAGVLRAALPLVVLPQHAGECFELAVVRTGRSPCEESEVVGAQVLGSGAVTCNAEAPARSDGWGRGMVGDWLQALLQGGMGKVRVGGSDAALVKTAVGEMHAALWTHRDKNGRPE
jgi:DNA-binding HxlR family transcriptional regulator